MSDDNETNMQIEGTFVLPDPPERDADDMTSFKHLGKTGNARYLAIHLGSPETTVVEGEKHLIPREGVPTEGRRYPDLLVAFGADPELFERNNGYITENQGKPPDFVLEVASPSTRETDQTTKREYYASMEVAEYWRFDDVAQERDLRLAGDRLVGSGYQPLEVTGVSEEVLQGYSTALNLILRWDHGQLVFIDPDTEAPIFTYEYQENRAEREAELRATAEAERDQEAARANRAEERIRQLEEENRRLRG